VNDLIQNSNAPVQLKTAVLGDRWYGTSVTITLQSSLLFDSVGIGFTDATEITINGEVVTVDLITQNGLYPLIEQTTDTVVLTHNGTFIGRLGIGVGHSVGISPPREPGYWTTSQSRRAEEGGVIPGAGGRGGRSIDVDIRYKIGVEMFRDFDAAYDAQISRGFPLFVLFDKEFNKVTGEPEKDRVPYERFYGAIPQANVFQSSVNRFLFSKRWKFVEAF